LDLGIAQKTNRGEVSVEGLISKVARGRKGALNHDKVVGRKRGHDHEMRNRVLIGKSGIDFFRPDTETRLAGE